jgi:hypothetical protein
MPCELHEVWNVRHGGGVLAFLVAAAAAEMIDSQAQAGMALGNAADIGEGIRAQHGDRNLGLLGGGPQPVEGAVGEPAARGIVQKRPSQTEHARLAAPRGEGRWGGPG